VGGRKTKSSHLSLLHQRQNINSKWLNCWR